MIRKTIDQAASWRSQERLWLCAWWSTQPQAHVRAGLSANAASESSRSWTKRYIGKLQHQFYEAILLLGRSYKQRP